LPFEVFNLFEDARIEYALRKNMKSFKGFFWSRYLFLEKPLGALDLFYWCVQKEADKTEFDNLYEKLNSELQQEHARVWEFYEKTIFAADSFRVIDIVEEWMQKMQDDECSIQSTLFHGEIDVLNIPDSVISLIQDAREVYNIDMADLNAQHTKAQTANLFTPKLSEYSINRLSNTNLLSSEPVRGDFDKKVIEQIVYEIEKIVIQTRRYTKTSTPTKRLNIRNILLNNPNIYKKKQEEKVQKNITLILDLSGSMFDIITALLPLVEGINILAQRGFIKGHLILSVSLKESVASFQTFAFPVQGDVLKAIQTYKATEGLSAVMQHLAPLLQKSDIVLVCTDALLADDPLNKHFFYRHHIVLYGIYLSNINRHGHDLERYFDNTIVADDVIGLTQKLVKILLKK